MVGVFGHMVGGKASSSLTVLNDEIIIHQVGITNGRAMMASPAYRAMRLHRSFLPACRKRRRGTVGLVLMEDPFLAHLPLDDGEDKDNHEEEE